MIQDIKPAVFHNEYAMRQPTPEDYIFVFKGRNILLKRDGDEVSVPRVRELDGEHLQFLFTINDRGDFLYVGDEEVQLDGYSYEPLSVLRVTCSRLLAFAGMTAYHLYVWYSNNRFCGRCGHATIVYDAERAMKCPECGNIVYPRISPAVIIGVTNGDKIVMTRYAGREYKGWALIAGFCEIGETAEETVEREVMEEVGLKVRNIRYYKSQPWGFESDLLLGYYCDLEGDDTLKVDTTELKVAEWVSRDDIEEDTSHISLTSEMMMNFKHGGDAE